MIFDAGAVRRRPELIPGLLGLAAFIVLATSGGGWEVTGWAPAGLFMLGLLVAAGFSYRSRLRGLDRVNLIAISLLGGFVLWSFASIIWADVQGTALEAANRALAYLIVYAVFSLVAWRADSAMIVLAGYALGLVVIGVVVLAEAADSSEAALSLVNGRLAEPTGYANAAAALFIGGFWPAVHIASRRDVPWPARALMLATAGFLVQIALMPQSRASLIVIPFALLLYMLVTPNRIRAAISLGLVLAATALTAPAVLDVYAIASDGGDVGAAFGSAANAMLISAVALLAIGSVVALADRRLEIGEATARVAGRVGLALSIAAAVVGLGIAVVALGDPIDWGSARWSDFKGDYDEGGFGSSRFSGDLGSGRYDFWDVALTDEFADSPVLGSGADNFAADYLQYRNTGEEPLYPHSLPIRILAGTGLVGAVLFAGFVIAAITAAVRTRARAPDPLGRGVAAVALATAGYFLLHSSGDWLWTFAAIAMPALAWLGIAGGGLRGSGAQARPAPMGLKVAAFAVAATLTLAAAVALALPWISARLTDSAAAGWIDDPQAAFSRLKTARDLNPLSARPDLVAGTIAVRDGRRGTAAAAFARAAAREPTNWYARLELGALEIAGGDLRRGEAELRRARALNPREPLIAMALRRARGDRPLTTREIDRELVRRVCARVGPTQTTRYCKD